jgi:hypothetical protein
VFVKFWGVFFWFFFAGFLGVYRGGFLGHLSTSRGERVAIGIGVGIGIGIGIGIGGAG